MAEARNGPFLAYERMREEIEAVHTGKIALIHEEDFVGAFPDFESAIEVVINRFDGKSCHVREIGVEYTETVFLGFEA
jgi:hypothetical protein